MQTRQFAAIFLTLALAACGGGGSSSSSPPPAESYTTAQAYIESEGFVGSVLVSKSGADVLRDGFGFANKAQQLRNRSDTRYRIGSVSKSFTALAVVQLHSTGLISSYDDPIADYLPDLPRGDEITIRHLLTHRSGIPDFLRQVDQDESYTPAQLVGLFAPRDLEFAPGSDFSYSNSNYVMLGYLIEALTGMSYEQYLQVNVLGPLGMINTEYGASTIAGVDYARGYLRQNQNDTARFVDMSIPYAAGALSSTLGDLEIWARSFMERTLVPANEYDAIFVEGEYGFAWVQGQVEGKTVYWHDGAINGFSAIVAMFPDDGGLVIALSNVQDQGELLQRIVTTMAAREL
jgi:CubicO group peptidase (beta-lactamase class C family)